MNQLLLRTMRTTDIPEKMLWKNAAIRQECYMRDTIGKMLKVPVFDIGHHTSKSIALPVYGLVMRNGIKIIARENFYNWMVSVVLPDGKSLPLNYIDTDLLLDYEGNGYIEGFKEEWIYDGYKPDTEQERFTISVYDDYKLYTILYLLNKAFPVKKFDDGSLTKEDVARFISETYLDSGIKTIKSEDDDMYAYEVFWNTYYNLEKYVDDRYDRESPLYQFQEKPAVYAELICRYPEIKELFAMEKYMYETKF